MGLSIVPFCRFGNSVRSLAPRLPPADRRSKTHLLAAAVPQISLELVYPREQLHLSVAEVHAAKSGQVFMQHLEWDLDAQIAMSDPKQFLETPRGVTLVPYNVGGSDSANSVDGVMSRFEQALSEVSAWVATAAIDRAAKQLRGSAG